MDEHLAPYAQISAQDRSPEAPHLSLTLETPPTFQLGASIGISITITRDLDGHDRPCIFRWDPEYAAFGPSGLVVLHHSTDTPNVFERLKIDVDPDDFPLDDDPSREPRLLSPCDFDFDFHQIHPGGNISWNLTLPPQYEDKLVPGERYTLCWPGGSIYVWDWGTIAEHTDRRVECRSPLMILPCGSPVSFEVVAAEVKKEEEAEWEEDDQEKEWEEWVAPPSPAPILPSSRIEGAPVLSVHLHGPGTLSSTIDHTVVDGCLPLRFPVTITVTYHTDPAGKMRPIVFRTYTLTVINKHNEGFRLDRCTGENGWTHAHKDNNPNIGGFMFLDDTLTLSVARDRDQFISLCPGESWSYEGMVRLPYDAVVGDEFRVRFKGTEVDWWDWGDYSTHAGTTVQVPCLAEARVVWPGDNKGRPRLVIPECEEFGFVVV